jgi:hypothetical protein
MQGCLEGETAMFLSRKHGQSLFLVAFGGVERSEWIFPSYTPTLAADGRERRGSLLRPLVRNRQERFERQETKYFCSEKREMLDIEKAWPLSQGNRIWIFYPLIFANLRENPKNISVNSWRLADSPIRNLRFWLLEFLMQLPCPWAWLSQSPDFFNANCANRLMARNTPENSRNSFLRVIRVLKSWFCPATLRRPCALEFTPFCL